MESCGASAAEAADVLNGVKVLNEAAQTTADETPEKTEDGVLEEDDFANNAHLPEWKQECIQFYVDCKSKAWTGNCYECIRRFEGQHEWPFALCSPPRKR